jgi:hypothetical protein
MRPCVAEIRVRSATASSRDYTNRRTRDDLPTTHPNPLTWLNGQIKFSRRRLIRRCFIYHSPALPFSSDYHSSDCHSPATAILQRLHSPATAIHRRLPFSSDCHSPATAIHRRLPFSGDYHSPATTILQRLPFNSTSYQESQLPIWKEP